MALTGKLRSWNDERGFGFIAPRDGGRELFVHISALPRDGSRPTVGETVTYELGRGKDGKPQAVNVYRQALGKPSIYPRERSHPTHSSHGRRSPINALIGLVLVLAIGRSAIRATNAATKSQRYRRSRPRGNAWTVFRDDRVQQGGRADSWRCEPPVLFD
jgi:cold shock CspA family protein